MACNRGTDAPPPHLPKKKMELPLVLKFYPLSLPPPILEFFTPSLPSLVLELFNAPSTECKKHENTSLLQKLDYSTQLSTNKKNKWSQKKVYLDINLNTRIQ